MSDDKELWNKIKTVLGGCSPVDPKLHPERAETIERIYEKLRPLFEQNIEEPSVSDETIKYQGREWTVLPIGTCVPIVDTRWNNGQYADVTMLAIRPVSKPLHEEWKIINRKGYTVSSYTRQDWAEESLVGWNEGGKEGPYRIVHMREVREEK